MVERGVMVNPNLATAWLCRGTVSVHMGNYQRGIEQLMRVLRMSPMDPDVHRFESFIGWAFLLQGKLAEAIEWSNRARRRQPNVGAALRVSAAANALAGNLAEARGAVAEMLGYTPRMTLSYVRSISPFRRLDDVERVFEGLRLAGLPE